MEQPLFSSPQFGDREPQFVSSSPRPNLDDVFADLTNQDVEPDAEPIENLHANEALEALNVSNASSRAASANVDLAPAGEGQTAVETPIGKREIADEEL